MIPNQPVVERNVVGVILYNPKENKVLCLNWNKFNWKTLIIGGIDAGENIAQAAEREIREETGYTNIKFIAEVGKVKSGFYAANANENRVYHATGVVFELISSDKINVDESENTKHVPEWVNKDEVDSFVNIDWQRYLLKRALMLNLS